MRLLFVIVFLLATSVGYSIEKLESKYLVSYGDEEAPFHVVKYFSFMCPHCLELFKREFQDIKSKYVNTNEITYTFHPVPKDLLTVCAMDCLGRLDGVKKQAFLEVMLEGVDAGDFDLSINLMKRAMEILEMPIPRLDDREYLATTEAYNAAFLFLKQDEQLAGVPAVEVNGTLYPKDVPDLEFLEKVIQHTEKKDVDQNKPPFSWSGVFGKFLSDVSL